MPRPAAALFAAVAAAAAVCGAVGGEPAPPMADLATRNSTTDLTVFSWNVHWQCGSNYVPGCRALARQRFVEMVRDTQAAIAVAIELEENSTAPLDLTTGANGLAGWHQVNGSCPPAPNSSSGDALALLFDPARFDVVRSGGGCLGGITMGPWAVADARAFAVALVRPAATAPAPAPAAPAAGGGAVRGCPDGLCVVGLHGPHSNITNGSAVVASVCGAAAAVRGARCAVAAGDWNAPLVRLPPPVINATVQDRWWQLFGSGGHGGGVRGGGSSSHVGSSSSDNNVTAAGPDAVTCCWPQSKYFGVDDHVATNVPGARVRDTHVFPYQLKMGNDTEEHKPVAATLALPLAPGEAVLRTVN